MKTLSTTSTLTVRKKAAVKSLEASIPNRMTTLKIRRVMLYLNALSSASLQRRNLRTNS